MMPAWRVSAFPSVASRQVWTQPTDTTGERIALHISRLVTVVQPLRMRQRTMAAMTTTVDHLITRHFPGRQAATTFARKTTKSHGVRMSC